MRGAVGGAVIAAASLVTPRGRSLSDVERTVLTEVFHGGLDLDGITVVPGRSGLLDLSDRPVTLGTTIFLKGSTSASVLVHEAVHVWQYRHGGARYVVDAVLAQCSATGYDWRAPSVTRWSELNVEAQAQFVQDLHAHPDLATTHPELARDARTTLRRPG